MKTFFTFILTTLSIFIISSASAQAPFYWDPTASGGTSLGGTAGGNWDTNSADPGTAIWYDGTADVVWTNSNNNDAYFTGNAGTVTIVNGEQIYADDIYFTNVVGNYDITNSTGAEVLNVANNIDTGGSEDIIGVQIANSTTLNKNGAGRLHLPVDSSATLSGNVIVNDGEVSVENNNSLGNNTTVTVTNSAALELNSTTNANLSSVNCNVILSGSGITNSGALRNTSGYTEFNGNVTIAGNVTIDSDVSQLNLNGYQGAAITATGNYNVTSTGAGAVLVDSGGFNIGTGSIIVEGPSTFYMYVTESGTDDLNTFTNVYVGAGGTFETLNDSSFGTVPATLMKTNVILDGGTLANASGYVMSSTRGITVTTNGGTIDNFGGPWTTCNIYSSNTAVTFTGTGNLRPAGSGGSSGNIVNLGTGAIIKDGSDDINTTYASSFTFSNMVLNGGSLTFNYDMSSGEPSTLGAIPSSYCPSNIWFNGGALHAGHSTTINPTRGIYVASGGGTIVDTVSSGGTITVDPPIIGPGGMTYPNGQSSHNTVVVLAGNNTYAGGSTINSSSTVNVTGGSGTLGLGNTLDNGTVQFSRTGTYSYGYDISGSGTLNNTGSGTVILGGTNTYSGATTTSAGILDINGTNGTSPITVSSGGTLGGSGVIAGTVTVNSGGTLALGTETLSVSNNVSIAGNITVSVNKSASPSSGMAIVTGTLGNTGTGTVSVSNLGPTLAPGDTFYLFNQQVSGGNTMTISGGGVTWVNNLASNGSISVLSALTSPGISNHFLSGTNFIFSGTNSADANAGFYVLASTNLLTPLSDWTRIYTNSFGANGAFSVTNPILPGSPKLFYILKLQ